MQATLTGFDQEATLSSTSDAYTVTRHTRHGHMTNPDRSHFILD